MVRIVDPKELFSCEGKTALVTGSAQGLGEVISLVLAQCGASLVLSDIKYPQKTAEQVKALGAKCEAVETDVSDESQVKDLADRALAAYGKVDILVNNAGISQLSFTPTEDLLIDEWDRVVNTNLRGTFLCCQKIGKQMIAAGGGSIVNIATTAGLTGVPRAPAYCASKAGVILLTKSLALEWARYQIRVNAVAPHYLETELTRGLRESTRVHDSLIRQIPLRRFGKTSEVVGAILYLCSQASSYVTGTVMPVDGGYLAQ
jgi:NAD(P)-dependent dehydrogenase (short-subunit alcohol dehydrogenase family)